MSATKTTERDWVEAIGEPAFESIAEMVAAVEVDWERLEELREHERNQSQWENETPDEAEELAELEAAAGDCEDEEDAQRRIEEDPLSIELGGWWTPGSEPEATEYRILLGTGGPATRIVGDLDEHREPSSARLEVQDWFKPWTEYPCDESVLLGYVSRFYMGE